MEQFLSLWTEYMNHAGYQAFALAKRDDGIRSANLFLEVVMKHLDKGQPPPIEALVANTDGWANGLLRVGKDHLPRGIAVSTFLGCFKTFIWAMQDALDCFYEIDCKQLDPDIENARSLLGIYGHAFEIIWVDTAMSDSTKDSLEASKAANHILSMEKCRFESVFNAATEGIMVMSHDCRVTDINARLAAYLNESVCGRFIWEALGIENVSSKEELFAAFPAGTQREVPLFLGNSHFQVVIARLGQFSLSHKHDYIVCLNDVTQLVSQRESLRAEVDRQTEDLLREKQLLEEMNITMRNIIKVSNEERETSHDKTAQAIRRFIGPALRKVVAENGLPAREAYAQLLVEHLERLLKPEQSIHSTPNAEGKCLTGANIGKLTITELKVCQLVQAGHTSKVIADLLNISTETVKTHRRSIRRKLNLRGNDSQLGTYLVQQQPM